MDENIRFIEVLDALKNTGRINAMCKLPVLEQARLALAILKRKKEVH